MARAKAKRVRIPVVPAPAPAGETIVEAVSMCICSNEQLEAMSSCGLPHCPNMAFLPKAEDIEHPVQRGAHVHHVAGVHSQGKPERGGPYWGRVERVLVLEGGGFEYEVMPEGSHQPYAKPFLTIWESHHIDEVLP